MDIKKIQVQICLGTTCFVMGSAKLQELEKFLPADLKDKVEIGAKACLGVCQQAGFSKAPFVKVGDEIIGEADMEKIVSKIREQIA